MEEDKVTITLTRDESLVLFEFLARCDYDEKQYRYADQAEERAIWNLQASLEKLLVEPFKPDYERIIQEARDRLRDKPV